MTKRLDSLARFRWLRPRSRGSCIRLVSLLGFLIASLLHELICRLHPDGLQMSVWDNVGAFIASELAPMMMLWMLLGARVSILLSSDRRSWS